MRLVIPFEMLQDDKLTKPVSNWDINLALDFFGGIHEADSVKWSLRCANQNAGMLSYGGRLRMLTSC